MVRVADIDLADGPRGATLRAPVDWEIPGVVTEPLEYVFLETAAASISGPADVVATALLFPAMRLGSRLVVDAPVSGRLLEGIRAAVDIWSGWDSSLNRIGVEASPIDRSNSGGHRVGALFSSGVDSFYTILRRRPDDVAIDTLVTIHGYDVRTSDADGFAFVRGRVERVAAELGKNRLFVETNMGRIGRRFLDWGLLQGSVLSSCALAYGSVFRRCYKASTAPYRFMKPWGTHPFVDPLFSTESLEVVHDGAESARWEKVFAIADSQLALDSLRVCSYELENCRRCSTCLYTMLALDAVDALHRSAALGPDLPLEDLANLRLYYAFLDEFAELVPLISKPAVREVAERVLRRTRRRRRYVSPIARRIRKVGLRPRAAESGPARRGRHARRGR